MRALHFAPALLVLAGCVAVSPPDQTFAARPGYGVIETVRDTRVAIPATGRETPAEDLTRRRYVVGDQLTLRMDDGTVQAITIPDAVFLPGERVQVTAGGRVLPGGVAPLAQAPVAQAPVVVVQERVVAPPSPLPIAVLAGMGTVESMSEPSASAGASVPGSAPQRPYRVTIRMDDGGAQTLSLDRPFQPGERVRVAPNGLVSLP
jgi:hypothetical protein